MEGQEKQKEYRTLYGSSSANSCAYCYKHHKALTPRQMRTKKCLEKQCSALKRCEHPYWVQREKKKEQRVARKERLEAMYKEATSGVRT